MLEQRCVNAKTEVTGKVSDKKNCTQMEEEELRNRWRRGGQIEYLEEKLKIAKPEPQWTEEEIRGRETERDTNTHFNT